MASSAVPCSGTITISSSSQATGVTQCESYDGDIRLGSAVNGSVSLNGIVTITGDLSVAYGSDIGSLSASDLVTIGDTLSISNNDLLTSLNFPALENVDTIDINGAPNLTEFKSTIGISNVSSIQIIETGLMDIDWVKSVNISRLEVEQNPVLSDIFLPVVNGLGSFTFARNGPAMKLSLASLRSAYNLTFSHVQTIDLLSLESVTHSLGFIANDLKTLSIERLSKLDDLMVWNNTALSQLDLPSLTNVSGDIVTNGNSAMESLSLPNLARVRGDIALNGSFTNISMPALVDVQGNVIIRSSASLDCSSLVHYDQSDVFKAQYNCTASELAVAPPPAPEPGSETNRGGGLSKGTIAGIAVGVVLGLLALALIVWCVWRKRGSDRSTKGQSNDTRPNAPSDSNFANGPYEADSQAVHPAELPARYNNQTSVTHEKSGSTHLGRAELYSEYPELHGHQRPFAHST
ncbi:uncharacterized protein A1O9_11948 [Exophiala aquamarina CBS 119918]|uniref:Receptor L-domain domain-containing protein n=1 Tax=Exophiala aquamarina CBS 119918 TaxID=1182545 RepID=A0A072NY34_9EURO|nr:uncharacterized protein A1O9_11948 [Exophiala aquamarina CBS 119918]KEF51958.1 hypothetical protein A1O9_11948 [Exophiala aquamarina CBS 119918]